MRVNLWLTTRFSWASTSSRSTVTVVIYDFTGFSQPFAASYALMTSDLYRSLDMKTARRTPTGFGSFGSARQMRMKTDWLGPLLGSIMFFDCRLGKTRRIVLFYIWSISSNAPFETYKRRSVVIIWNFPYHYIILLIVIYEFNVIAVFIPFINISIGPIV